MQNGRFYGSESDRQGEFEQEKNSVRVRSIQSINSSMQVQKQAEIINSIIFQLPKSAMVQVVGFLDVGTLGAINEAAPKNIHQQEFFQLVRAYYFVTNYLNRTDRSLYYTFYDEGQFRRLELNLIANITEDHFKTFQQCSLKYAKVFAQIPKLLPDSQDLRKDLLEELQNSLTDPWLPLPKLRRQNVGMFCNSPFQFYLTDLKYGMKTQQDSAPAIQDLKAQFQALQSKHFKLFIEIGNKKREQLSIIKQVRLTPFRITSDNMESYYVKDHQLHNLIVSLFAAADLLVESSKIYVESISDPYHKFVEFNLRYSIFRNFVLDIQEKFNFAFEMYGDLYQQIFHELQQKPKYNFWRPAMTKWIQKMKQFHKENQRVYCHCLTKIRSRKMEQIVRKLCEKQPETYMYKIGYIFSAIRNRIEQREFEIMKGEEIYEQCGGRDVEEYFQNNPELYQLIGAEYTEYIIDLSVNQHAVHWCGHSEHVLEEPYPQFELQFLQYNQDYYSYLAAMAGEGFQAQKALKQLLKSEVAFLEASLIKPVTLTKVLKQANEAIHQKRFQTHFENFEESEVLISFDFENRDSVLRHFNQKAEILSELAENSRCFYSILPLCPAEKILASSVDTRHTDNMNDSFQDLGDYFSDGDSDSVHLGGEVEKMDEEDP